jgi:hypothetical protein
MDAEAVGERLRRACEAGDARRLAHTSLAAEDVTRRLRKVSELRDLCLALGRAVVPSPIR